MQFTSCRLFATSRIGHGTAGVSPSIGRKTSIRTFVPTSSTGSPCWTRALFSSSRTTPGPTTITVSDHLLARRWWKQLETGPASKLFAQEFWASLPNTARGVTQPCLRSIGFRNRFQKCPKFVERLPGTRGYLGSCPDIKFVNFILLTRYVLLFTRSRGVIAPSNSWL